MTERKAGAKPRSKRPLAERDEAAERQRARERAGDDPLPRRSGPAKGGGGGR